MCSQNWALRYCYEAEAFQHFICLYEEAESGFGKGGCKSSRPHCRNGCIPAPSFLSPNWLGRTPPQQLLGTCFKVSKARRSPHHLPFHAQQYIHSPSLPLSSCCSCFPCSPRRCGSFRWVTCGLGTVTALAVRRVGVDFPHPAWSPCQLQTWERGIPCPSPLLLSLFPAKLTPGAALKL